MKLRWLDMAAKHQPRLVTWGGAGVALLMALVGCAPDRLELLVVDERDRPLEGVLVAYRQGTLKREHLMEIGCTDSTGTVLLGRDHLAFNRTYMFVKSYHIGSCQYFDDSRCLLVTQDTVGTYAFDAWEGTYTRQDLLRSRGRSGKNVQKRVQLLPLRNLADLTQVHTSSELQKRMLSVETTPGARVHINGRPHGTASPQGRLDGSLCPADLAGCFACSVQVRIAKQRHLTEEWNELLCPPGDTLRIARRLETIPDRESPPPRAPDSASSVEQRGPARVRLENRTNVRQCGQATPEYPSLLVNATVNRVARSPASDSAVTYYDLLLDRGQTYCIAIECPRDGQVPGSWAPWLPDVHGGPTWFQLEVPPAGGDLYFQLPEPQDPTEISLVPGSGSLDGFDAGSYHFTSACPQQ